MYLREAVGLSLEELAFKKLSTIFLSYDNWCLLAVYGVNKPSGAYCRITMSIG